MSICIVGLNAHHNYLFYAFVVVVIIIIIIIIIIVVVVVVTNDVSQVLEALNRYRNIP